MTTNWQPYREPLRVTLVRTIAIALVAGAVFSPRFGGLTRWPIAAALMLWPSLGGHYVELWFLNWLRPRLPDGRSVQIAARFVVWFIGGLALAVGMQLTALAIINRRALPLTAWWLAGVVFIGVELVAQLTLQLRGRASFYNGRG